MEDIAPLATILKQYIKLNGKIILNIESPQREIILSDSFLNKSKPPQEEHHILHK